MQTDYANLTPEERLYRERLAHNSVAEPAISLAEIDALRVAREKSLRRAASSNLFGGLLLGILVTLLCIGLYGAANGSFAVAGGKVDSQLSGMSRATGEAARATGASVDESLANARESTPK